MDGGSDLHGEGLEPEAQAVSLASASGKESGAGGRTPGSQLGSELTELYQICAIREADPA